MMRSPDEVAVVIAAAMQRFIAGNTVKTKRGRFSAVNIKRLSGREVLTPSFLMAIKADLQEFGFGLLELATGGYAVIEIAALESAPIFNPFEFMTATEKTNLHTEQFSPVSYLANLDNSRFDNEPTPLNK